MRAHPLTICTEFRIVHNLNTINQIYFCKEYCTTVKVLMKTSHFIFNSIWLDTLWGLISVYCNGLLKSGDKNVLMRCILLLFYTLKTAMTSSQQPVMYIIHISEKARAVVQGKCCGIENSVRSGTSWRLLMWLMSVNWTHSSQTWVQTRCVTSLQHTFRRFVLFWFLASTAVWIYWFTHGCFCGKTLC